MILVVVLIVAGLGLAFDRVIIGSDVTSPAESSAGVLDIQPDPESLLIQPAPAQEAVSETVVSLADRLRIATAEYSSDSADKRDAFVVSSQWLTTEQAPGKALGVNLTQALEAFKRDNRLDAVMVTGDQRCAVINGQTLFVGQTLQGYRLVAVHERSAEFVANGVRVLLGIRGGGPAS